VRRYFGSGASKWRAVRNAMLTPGARDVFASRILATAALE
jgi:hypothetical protein